MIEVSIGKTDQKRDSKKRNQMDEMIEEEQLNDKDIWRFLFHTKYLGDISHNMIFGVNLVTFGECNIYNTYFIQ